MMRRPLVAPLLSSCPHLRTAVPVAQPLALRGGAVAATAVSTSPLARVVASALGWTLTLGALSVYAPIITEMLRTRSAKGLSTTTWALQLVGFLTFVVYHIRMGLPLSTFLDFAALAAQSLVILVLACTYERKVPAAAALPVAALLAACFLPARALSALQLSASVAVIVALVPQIVRNFAARSRGGWSPISAALSTGGNFARLYTTVTLAASNPLLLLQFGVSFVLNAILLVQSLIWS